MQTAARLLPILAFPVLLFPLPGAAEETPTVLDETVVSGSREATPLAATPAAIDKLDAKALSNIKATSIPQAVNLLPGVYMADLGNEQHSMSIRQPITTNAVYQYLEDGVPIRPVGIFNHNALNEINLTGAGEVEVLKGPASSLYGSNAVGGAVNFLTRAPSATPRGVVVVPAKQRRLPARGFRGLRQLRRRRPALRPLQRAAARLVAPI